jgi:antitoxin component YwqK of YwqJK toxin-antitoxin module
MSQTNITTISELYIVQHYDDVKDIYVLKLYTDKTHEQLLVSDFYPSSININRSGYVLKLSWLNHKHQYHSDKHYARLIFRKSFNINSPKLDMLLKIKSTRNYSYILPVIRTICDNNYYHIESKEWFINGKLHNDYNPAVLFYDNTGEVIKKFYYQNDKLHSIDNDTPAIFQYNKESNSITEYYYKNGDIHRDNDRPAYISYSTITGLKLEERWYMDNMLYRDNEQPMVIRYHHNSNIKSKSWYNEKDNLHHSTNYAYICYYDNGNVHKTIWMQDGKYHNENDKAYVIYHHNGNIDEMHWYVNGMLHNTNGPAFIKYDTNGNMVQSKYYRNDVLHNEYNKPAVIDYYDDRRIEKYYRYGIYMKVEVIFNDNPSYSSNNNVNHSLTNASDTKKVKLPSAPRMSILNDNEECDTINGNVSHDSNDHPPKYSSIINKTSTNIDTDINNDNDSNSTAIRSLHKTPFKRFVSIFQRK